MLELRWWVGLAAAWAVVTGTAPDRAAAQSQVPPRMMIAFDTSGSMATDLQGRPTFGDGVLDHCTEQASGAYCGDDCTAGIDTDCNGEPDDSRIYIARQAVRNMILSTGGDIDWALSRFSQAQSEDQLCSVQSFGGGQFEDWTVDTVECDQAAPTSYGNPQCNSGRDIDRCGQTGSFGDWFVDTDDWPSACTPGESGEPALQEFEIGDPNVCVNYVPDSCDETAGSGDVLVGFPDRGPYDGRTNAFGLLKWVDNTQTNFNTDTTTGDFCEHSMDGDCELRPVGRTALAGILRASRDYMAPIRDGDPKRNCRPYSIILLTDGIETCDGNPQSTAQTLYNDDDIKTYVVGLSIATQDQRDNLDAIADSGGTVGAFFADDPDSLSAALSQIVSESLKVEVCDGVDNDCDDQVDEGYSKFCDLPNGETDEVLCDEPDDPCDGEDSDCDGEIDEGNTNACGGCGPVPDETCDQVDNDCDGTIDEGVCGGCSPEPEICNGSDEDCDGNIDEDLTRVCGTDVGICERGQETCTDGSWGECQGNVEPEQEQCNGTDDDCDGVVDGMTRPCGTDVGVCQQGSEVCTDGSWDSCTGNIEPSDEVCDDADNDCDGTVDETFPGEGESCGTDFGVCNSGTLQCVGGERTCAGSTGPEGAETCDSRDEDCDGSIDEEVPPDGTCGMDQGQCSEGSRQCVDGSFQCVGAVGPRDEICDGVDNDCDGSIDEDDPELGQTCGQDTGQCESGTYQCTGGELICEGATGPTEEVCDGLDNDCDGVPDDGLGVGAPCGQDTGECVPGNQVCRDGEVVCEGQVEPTEEVCDLLDNDCDGTIDEGIPVGEPCGTDEGICQPGETRCIDGSETCVGSVPPGTEVCDCQDNDCDGSIDEQPQDSSLCPDGSACVQCACSVQCQQNEFGYTCPTGRTPQELDSGECYCVRDQCDSDECGERTIEQDGEIRCAPDRDDVSHCVCKNNTCTFPCEGVVCGEGLVCDPDDPEGRCVEDDCRGLGCAGGELCNVLTGQCEPHPCEDVSCAPGEACRAGQCEPSCADVQCAAGEVCESGECVPDRCTDINCVEGQVCNPATGECIDDACRDVRCVAGAECNPATGECELEACARVRCPEGQVCDDGQCRTDGTGEGDGGTDPDGGTDEGEEDERRRVLATGKGGCACTVPQTAPSSGPTGPGSLAVAGLLLGLLLWRRRRGMAAALRRRVVPPVRHRRSRPGTVARRALRTGALLMLALLLGGCDVQPFCLDCVDAAADAQLPGEAGSEGGTRTEAGTDAGAPDAGPDASGPDGCVPGAPERCNEADDDCDGNVDEGIDTQSNPEHCGGCGQRCAPPHAFAECTDGQCNLSSCDVSWHDLNGDVSDGCEYRCQATAEDDSTCDLRDNDCDGDVDEDVNLQTDPNNCGSCGHLCRFAHVTDPQCQDGSCTFEAPEDCEEGFWDADGDPENGCEYACTRADPPTEVCNARDDDCDGEIDEGNPGGGARCGTNQGDCTAGTERCIDGSIVCDGATEGGSEVCDGDDNDCDSEVDEGNPGGGGTCGSDQGVCSAGRNECVEGEVVCVGSTDGGSEVCDGVDNDCDGTIDESDPQLGNTCGTGTGQCSTGTIRCIGGTLRCDGEVTPSTEVCDGDDNDCDDQTDEGFDLQNDIRNCGSCGNVCSFMNATAGCSMGDCYIRGCDENYHNPDGDLSNGCEYSCVFAGEEICNGSDDDCDGATDEGVTPPDNFCNPNGVCSGTSATCEGSSGWSCDYPSSYESEETTCDGLDNDCDGTVDDPYPSVGDPCANGTGSCRRTGTIVCTSDGSGVVCNADPAGDPAADDPCDAEDNDCDGTVDEDAASAMPIVPVTLSDGSTVHVMQYEASRPDATDQEQGDMTSYACANPGVLPWTNVTWGQARDACCALNADGQCADDGTGWRLCGADVWEAACRSPSGDCTWGYASSCSTSQPQTCNGEEYDCDSATSGDQDCLMPTASSEFPMCYADWSDGPIHDLSGNAKEWTSTERSGMSLHEIRGGSYNNIEPGRTCGFDFTVGNEAFSFPNTGFRCCLY